MPETFGDYISKFSQICGYISKLGQINFNPVTTYSHILTIFRDLTKFRNIVTKSFGHREEVTAGSTSGEEGARDHASKEAESRSGIRSRY